MNNNPATDNLRRRLTDAERETLKATLRANPQDSIVSIARASGVAPHTALKHREELERTEGLVSVYWQSPTRQPFLCFTCECGVEVVGGPYRCSECRAALVKRVLTRRVAA